MIRVGIAGIGFMGMVHYLSYQKLKGVKVVALCEQNEKRLAGDWRDIKGNFGPPGKRMDLSGISTYTRLEDLIADDSVDLVDVTLPPGLHAETTVKALRGGKHVFCEKPMALTIAECQRMTAAAKKAKKMLVVGHVLPFFPEYQWAYEIIHSGKYGGVLGGTFKRVISDPAWLPDYWSAEKVGGPMLDLHVHDAHFIRLLFGMPQTVNCRGRVRQNLAEYWNTQFDYGNDGPTVLATSGIIRQQGRPFCHGFEIHLEEATLAFEFAVIGSNGSYLCEPVIFDSKGKSTRKKFSAGDPMDAFERELKEVVQCVNSETTSAILAADLAQDAITLCHKQTDSLLKGRPVKL